MTPGTDFETAVGGNRGLRAVNGHRELRPGLQHVDLGRRVHRPLEVAGAPAERIGEGQENPPDFLGLLLLERDDVVVDLDRAERLEEEARAAAGAAMDDARNRRPVLGSHDEDVPAVAIGHDLLLQVFGRVLAAQIRLERAAQPRALLPQPIAHAAQLRARIVDDLAPGVDLAADVGDLRFEGGGGVGNRAQNRTGAPGAPHGGARDLHGGQERAESQEVHGFERPAFDGERGQDQRRGRPARADRAGFRRGSGRSRRWRPAPRRPCSDRSRAAARRAAPRPEASARSGGRPPQCDRIRGPSGLRHASGRD